MNRIVSFLALVLACVPAVGAVGPDAASDRPLPLVAERPLPILVAAGASEQDRFAASELASYLKRITGRQFPIRTADAPLPESGLFVGRTLAEGLGEGFSAGRFGDDGFLMRRDHGRVLLAGAGERGTLYAVYGFLEKLGCGWYAPNFEFYGAAAGEHIPHLDNPEIGDLDVVEKPSFRWRQKYIEEGETHTPARLIALVDWMAKVHLNILGCAIDYQGEGRTKWDNWREALIPEAKKRGILLEIGGHGYQVFLPASRYFAQHPDWFGMDHGKRSDDPKVVFSTANPEAMATYIASVRDYLRSHPEIDIFDCRPPDSSHWSTAPEDEALGTPTDRQLLLIRQLGDALKPEFPRLKIIFEAYSTLIDPPDKKIEPPSNALMEFCPINRSFVGPIYDPKLAENRQYFPSLEKWIGGGTVAAGDVAITTYITKYQWRSLPVLIPHLIALESARYRQMGIGGMSSYSEPGAWASLELDHYFLARYLWNAGLDPDSELAEYTSGRYGAAASEALAYLRLVESVVPNAVVIPGTHLELRSEQRYIARFRQAVPLLAKARTAAAGRPDILLLLDKLEGSRRYAENEMQLRAAFLEAGTTWRRDQIKKMEALLAERAAIIQANASQGLIVVDARTY